ncbi:MAG TPA: AAC(3) family N-acetyltransferase [Polyangiaceae bacterium]|nr:AAC(3) family N-acetyltransferase [Polyangiaceae bacterium]
MNLTEELTALGVRPGQLLMLHASLRALGLARSQGVENGAERVLDAITEILGPTGTLLMILGTASPHDWVNQHPIAERARLLEGAAPLDYLSAPVLPEVGWVAEAFRRRPGTLVSNNPSGRFAASGARAAELLRDQPWNDYYGPGSPLDKLCAWGGQVLRLGPSPDTTTVLHYAEYLAAIPDKRRTRWDYVLQGPDGPRHTFVECLDDNEGIVAWEGEDYFALILEAYLALGRHRAGKVGQAQCELIDAADIVRFGARWMETHLLS